MSQICAEGHEGPYCNECATEFHKSTSGECEPCEGDTLGITLTAAFMPMVMMFMACYCFICLRARRRARLAKKKKKEEEEDAKDENDPRLTEKERAALRAQRLERQQERAMKAEVVAERGQGIARLSRFVSRAATAASKHYVKLRIIVSFAQVLSGTGTVFDIRWPPIMTNFLSWMGIFTLDFINLMPMDCVLSTNYHWSLVISTVWPLTTLAIVFALRQRLLRSSKESNQIIADHLLTFIFAVFFVIYPTVSFKISATFQCDTLDDAEKLEDRSRVLRADFTVDCRSWAHFRMMIYAFVMTFIYPIGIPSLYVYLLYIRFGWQMRRLRDISKMRASIYDSAQCRTGYEASKPAMHELKAEANQRPVYGSKLRKAISSKALLFSKVVSKAQSKNTKATHARKFGRWLLGRKPKMSAEMKAMIEQDYTMSLARLDTEEEVLMNQLPDFVRKLISGYKLKCFWFEIFECVRKLALVCAPIAFEAGSENQLIFGICICFGTFGVYMLLSPYISIGEDRLAQLCQTQIFLVLVISIALRSSQGRDGGSKDGGKEQQLDVWLTLLITLPIFLSLLLDFIAFKFLREKSGGLNKKVEETRKKTRRSKVRDFSILPGANSRERGKHRDRGSRGSGKETPRDLHDHTSSGSPRAARGPLRFRELATPEGTPRDSEGAAQGGVDASRTRRRMAVQEPQDGGDTPRTRRRVAVKERMAAMRAAGRSTARPEGASMRAGALTVWAAQPPARLPPPKQSAAVRTGADREEDKATSKAKATLVLPPHSGGDTSPSSSRSDSGGRNHQKSMVAEFEKQQRAATKLQAVQRGSRARRWFGNASRSATKLQAVQRGSRARSATPPPQKKGAHSKEPAIPTEFDVEAGLPAMPADVPAPVASTATIKAGAELEA